LDQGNILCAPGLDRCGKFTKMHINEFLKLDASLNFENTQFDGGEDIVGSTCMSQADCASIKCNFQAGAIHMENRRTTEMLTLSCDKGLDRCAYF
ncbi:hypothetical protein PENTCL1PPCAC_5210, partial [Pristionchus entomophagus]